MTRSRRTPSRSAKRRTYKSGRVTRNPFLNFMRDFRKTRCGLKLTELTRKGAEVWRKMNNRQRSPYCHLARQAPKRRNRRKKRKTARRRRRRGRRRRSAVRRRSGGERDGDRGYCYESDSSESMERREMKGRD